MSIYTGFELNPLEVSLIDSGLGEVVSSYLLFLLVFSRFGIMWTANSPNTLGSNRALGQIGNNKFHNNDISLYLGIDHPDVPLAQLSSNGLTINSISDISNYKIHVKTWCNYFDNYTTAGMMLGSDLRDQGDVNMAPSNYSSNLNGFELFNPNLNLTNFFVPPSSSGSPFDLLFNLSTLNLYSPNISNQPFIAPTSFANNGCLSIPGYKRNSTLLESNIINSKNNLRNSLRIYPNPFENDLRIESSQIELKNLEVFDVLGRLILKLDRINNKDFIINFNRSPGCYLLKVILMNGEVTYHKIVKSND